jgi:hypothetical protein
LLKILSYIFSVSTSGGGVCSGGGVVERGVRSPLAAIRAVSRLNNVSSILCAVPLPDYAAKPFTRSDFHFSFVIIFYFTLSAKAVIISFVFPICMFTSSSVFITWSSM